MAKGLQVRCLCRQQQSTIPGFTSAGELAEYSVEEVSGGPFVRHTAASILSEGCWVLPCATGRLPGRVDIYSCELWEGALVSPSTYCPSEGWRMLRRADARRGHRTPYVINLTPGVGAEGKLVSASCENMIVLRAAIIAYHAISILYHLAPYRHIDLGKVCAVISHTGLSLLNQQCSESSCHL